MKKDKKESHYEKVEIIKIPYKLFRKKLYEDYSKILKEIPYRLYRKILYEFQRRRDSGKSLISFIEKSYMIFKGTVIVLFEDSGKSLIVFSEKS